MYKIKSDAIKIYISNVMTQPGETDNFAVSDHIKTLMKYSGKNSIEYVIANNGTIPNEIKDIINEGVTILEDYYYRDIIRKREIYGHKGDYGRAIIFAGSKGFTGAAYLATKACLKTGAGLTTLITPKDIQDILSGMLIESMTSNFNEEEKVDKLISTANAIAYGPGLPSSKEYEDFLLYISKNSSVI